MYLAPSVIIPFLLYIRRNTFLKIVWKQKLDVCFINNVIFMFNHGYNIQPAGVLKGSNKELLKNVNKPNPPYVNATIWYDYIYCTNILYNNTTVLLTVIILAHGFKHLIHFYYYEQWQKSIALSKRALSLKTL